MSVGRICVREVDLAEPHESVQIAARRMNARNVGTLMVLAMSLYGTVALAELVLLRWRVEGRKE